jgi:hypothetical protein
VYPDPIISRIFLSIKVLEFTEYIVHLNMIINPRKIIELHKFV